MRQLRHQVVAAGQGASLRAPGGKIMLQLVARVRRAAQIQVSQSRCAQDKVAKRDILHLRHERGYRGV